jgi:prevent-host-death family protein
MAVKRTTKKPRRRIGPEMGVAEFKARCLEVLRHVSTTGLMVTVTKRGEPLVALLNAPKRGGSEGCMIGTGEIVGDIMKPGFTDDDWALLEAKWKRLYGARPGHARLGGSRASTPKTKPRRKGSHRPGGAARGRRARHR